MRLVQRIVTCFAAELINRDVVAEITEANAVILCALEAARGAIEVPRR
jgi:hypothetical protein